MHNQEANVWVMHSREEMGYGEIISTYTMYVGKVRTYILTPTECMLVSHEDTTKVHPSDEFCFVSGKFINFCLFIVAQCCGLPAQCVLCISIVEEEEEFLQAAASQQG